MKKKIIIIIFILVILIIPFFIFNDKQSSKKTIVKKTKTDKIVNKEKFKYITIGHDNINNYIKEEEKEEERIIYVCINQ